MAPTMIEMLGKRFGRLVVVERVIRPGNTFWRVQCDCGTEKVMGGHAIRIAMGCGCVRAERLREMGRSNRRHGMTDTPTWKAWNSMRDRCRNVTNKDYPKYGGRGIRITERWDTFEGFFADMGERPAGTSLDRMDVNGDYAPENCRWADASTQSKNQRRFIDPIEKEKWVAAVLEGQRRSRDKYCAAQKRRWQRWRDERAAQLKGA